MRRKIVTINEYNECVTRLVILLEIVMVIPVKHESQSRTNESPWYNFTFAVNVILNLSIISKIALVTN